LLGQKQIVMKSIEANYQKVEGISAATILGDGEVAFVLDVPGLSRLAKRKI
jgi:two-component system, chemotaxis family, sensor kinase CheA